MPGVLRGEPYQNEAQCQEGGGETHEGNAPSVFRAGAVGNEAENGIVERVPDAVDQGGQPDPFGTQAQIILIENGQQSAEDAGDQVAAQGGDPPGKLEFEGQLLRFGQGRGGHGTSRRVTSIQPGRGSR